MNTRLSQLGLAALLLTASPTTTRGQGTVEFRNLSFEEAVLVPWFTGDPSLIQFGPAFPGWTGVLVDRDQPISTYNNSPITFPGFGLRGPTTGSPTDITDGRISGTYTAVLHARPEYGGPLYLSQTALVPSDSTTLYFRTKPGNNLRVSLGGTDLPFVPLTLTTNWQSYGADIRSYAGTVAELRFTAISETFLDDIRFTTLAIPEPGMIALLALGGAGIALWRRRRRR